MSTTLELHWKKKFERLSMKVLAIHEESEFMEEEQPKRCITDSDVFYMSHDMQICDNETYAKRHWGNKYIKLVRA